MSVIVLSMAVLLAAQAPSRQPAASEELKCGNEVYDSLRPAVAGGWPGLRAHWQRYKQCDDGYFAEAYATAVVDLLRSRWDRLSEFWDLAKSDDAFRDWVLRHIGSTSTDDELEDLISKAGDCPPGLDVACKLIGDAAAQAQRELCDLAVRQMEEVYPPARRGEVAGAWARVHDNFSRWRSCWLGSANEERVYFQEYLFADHWGQVDEFLTIAAKDPAFASWVIDAFNGLGGAPGYRRIAKNAANRCPKGAERICSRIQTAAETAAADGFAIDKESIGDFLDLFRRPPWRPGKFVPQEVPYQNSVEVASQFRLNGAFVIAGPKGSKPRSFTRRQIEQSVSERKGEPFLLFARLSYNLSHPDPKLSKVSFKETANGVEVHVGQWFRFTFAEEEYGGGLHPVQCEWLVGGSDSR